MPARQIKSKPVPPLFKYSERLATEAEIAEARRCSKNQPLGCIIGTIIGILTFCFGALVWGTMGHPQFGTLWVILAAIAAPYIVVKAIELSVFGSNLEKIVTARLRSQHLAIQANESNATTAVLAKVETIYSSQKSNLETLRSLLGKADTSLSHAQQFFKERAYTPFWDSIEDAVESLRQFDKLVSYINRSAKEYYANLDGREHTFPTFPLKSEDLPNPNALMKHLAERIAEAQRDFQFASIFEQRRTTSAIVTGFRNTQEAITSLRNDIVSSLSDLQNSLESGLENISSNIREGFDDLAESHKQSTSELRETLDGHAKETAERDAKHQKFVEGTLDNIQNRRKPRLSETKEPFRKGGDS